MDKELTLEEAENIVDNMYQKRWEECGVDDGNTIHIGNLDKLHYSEFERASILLLRTEIRLKRENQNYKKAIDKLKEYLIDSIPVQCDISEYSVQKIKDILKEVR